MRATIRPHPYAMLGFILMLGSCINVSMIDASHNGSTPHPVTPVVAPPPSPPAQRVLCDPPPELILDPPPTASASIIAALKKDVDRGIGLLGDYIRELKSIIKNNSDKAQLALDKVRSSCKKYP